MPLGKIIQLVMRVFKQQTSELEETQQLSVAESLTPEISFSPVIQESETDIAITVNEDIVSSATTFDSIDRNQQSSKAITMINFSMLQQELQTFVSGSADVQGATLVSPDGLALASVLAADMDEERTAAMSASILSLGERIASELGRGIVERIVVEGEKGYGVLVGCGSDAVLLVLAGKGVKQGILFLEVKRVVTRLAPLLA